MKYSVFLHVTPPPPAPNSPSTHIYDTFDALRTFMSLQTPQQGTKLREMKNVHKVASNKQFLLH